MNNICIYILRLHSLQKHYKQDRKHRAFTLILETPPPPTVLGTTLYKQNILKLKTKQNKKSEEASYDFPKGDKKTTDIPTKLSDILLFKRNSVNFNLTFQTI